MEHLPRQGQLAQGHEDERAGGADHVHGGGHVLLLDERRVGDLVGALHELRGAAADEDGAQAHRRGDHVGRPGGQVHVIGERHRQNIGLDDEAAPEEHEHEEEPARGRQDVGAHGADGGGPHGHDGVALDGVGRVGLPVREVLAEVRVPAADHEEQADHQQRPPGARLDRGHDELALHGGGPILGLQGLDRERVRHARARGRSTEASP
mmetsp:Transcript_55034/g.154802  ORF Transcript_55034/g.154802 Transcript_55034/m.154802 type:complete len:208 (+) Transcript_55034:714-1337(+)